MRSVLAMLLCTAGPVVCPQVPGVPDVQRIVQSIQDTSESRHAFARNLLLTGSHTRIQDIVVSTALLDTALAVAEEVKDTTLIVGISLQLGVNAYYAGHYLTALSRYSGALPLAEQLDNRPYIGDLHHLIGSIYLRQLDYRRALASTKKALAIRREVNQGYDQAKSLQSIGTAYMGLGMCDSALIYYDQSVRLLDLIGSTKGVDVAYKNIGECQTRTGDYDAAEASFRKSLELREVIDNNLGRVYTLTSFARLRIKQERFREAIGLAREALDLAEGMDLGDQLATVHFVLAQGLAGLGEYAAAYHALMRHTSIADSLSEQQSSDQLTEMLALFEVNEREKEIAVNQAELEKTQAELERTRTWRNAVVIIGALVLVSALVIIWNFRRQAAIEKKLMVAQLAEQKKREEVHALQSMIKGQEEERYRVGREIHDALGSRLGSLRFFIERLLDVPAEEKQRLLAEAGHTLDDIVDEVRRISANMMPGALKKFGLRAAINQLTDELRDRSKLDVHFHSTEDVKLDDETEVMLYRIIQEATNNIVKHAQASEVDIVLSQEDDRVVLSVQDNGKGFELSTIRNGSGLASMETRVQIMDGSFDIDSNPGEGTSLLINIPLNVNHK